MTLILIIAIFVLGFVLVGGVLGMALSGVEAYEEFIDEYEKYLEEYEKYLDERRKRNHA